MDWTSSYECLQRGRLVASTHFIPVSPAELFKRTSIDVNVCGWVGGNSDLPATCESGSSCIRDTVHGIVGCCTTSGACNQGVYTSCVDVNSAGWVANTGLQENGIYTCAGTSVCYRNTYAGAYYQYGCGASGDAAQVETTYTGQASDALLQVVYTAVNFASMPLVKVLQASSSTSISSSTLTTSFSSSTLPTSSSSTSDVSPTSTTSFASQTVPSTSSDLSVTPSYSTTSPTASSLAATNTQTQAPTKHKTTSPAIIAASVIASLIALSALLVALLFFCHRKRQNRSKRPLHSSLFITKAKSVGSSVSGTFTRVAPEDAVEEDRSQNGSPMPEQDISCVLTYGYGGLEMQQPSGADGRWGAMRESEGVMESVPLVGEETTENVPLVDSESENASHNYLTLNPEHNAHTYVLSDALISAPSVLSSNSDVWSQNEKSGHVGYQDQTFTPQQHGWTPRGLRRSTLRSNLRISTSTNFNDNSNTVSHFSANSSLIPPLSSSSSSHTSHQTLNPHSEQDGSVSPEIPSPEIPIPPRSPLRESRMRSMDIHSVTVTRVDSMTIHNQSISPPLATVMTADSPVDASRKRYQLVDEVVENREDVIMPVLASPGRKRYQLEEMVGDNVPVLEGPKRRRDRGVGSGSRIGKLGERKDDIEKE